MNRESNAPGRSCYQPASWPFWLHVVLSGAIGLVLLASGLIKATDMSLFMRQIRDYGIITHQHLLLVSAWALIVVETGLGAGLLLRYRLGFFFPATVLLFLFFLGATGWASWADMTGSCGCFGVALDHTPAEAMLLDLVLLALTLTGWIGTRGRPEKDARLGGWLVTAALILGIALPALFGFKMPEAGGPENSSMQGDLNTLQVRGPEPVSLTKGDFLVVLMDTDCGTCREKVPLLDRLSRKSGLPQVIGLFKNDNEKIALFFEEFEPAFKTAQISEDDFWDLLGYGDIPRTLLIRDGTVIKVWDKAIPDEATVTGAM